MKGYVVKDAFLDTNSDSGPGPNSDSDDDIVEQRYWDTDTFRAVVDEYLSYPPGSQEREQFVTARKEYVNTVQEVSLCSIIYLCAILTDFP